MIQYTCSSYGPRLLIFVSQSWENCGLLKGTGLQMQIWISFEGNDFYVNIFFWTHGFMNASFLQIDAPNQDESSSTKTCHFCGEKGEKTAAFSKKSGGFSTTAFAYKEFLDKGVLETEENWAEWAVSRWWRWFGIKRTESWNVISPQSSKRCSISLQLSPGLWTGVRWTD